MVAGMVCLIFKTPINGFFLGGWVVTEHWVSVSMGEETQHGTLVQPEGLSRGGCFGVAGIGASTDALPHESDLRFQNNVDDAVTWPKSGQATDWR